MPLPEQIHQVECLIPRWRGQEREHELPGGGLAVAR
jgi:hypothetical protein